MRGECQRVEDEVERDGQRREQERIGDATRGGDGHHVGNNALLSIVVGVGGEERRIDVSAVACHPSYVTLPHGGKPAHRRRERWSPDPAHRGKGERRRRFVSTSNIVSHPWISLATRKLASQTLVEVSPVILFTEDEYESHGKHTILDEYTFCWPGRSGSKALALGIGAHLWPLLVSNRDRYRDVGSLFNHSSTPNLIYKIDKSSQTIRFSTTRPIESGEELCIFYAHNLWFEDTSQSDTRPRRAVRQIEEDNGPDVFADLSKIDIEKDQSEEFVPDEDLPFEEVRYMDSEDEDLDDIPTSLFSSSINALVSRISQADAWVVEVPDQRHITVLLEYELFVTVLILG